jgi:hypothetical protein
MIPKRTIDEFLLIYRVEPTLLDVFCEGPSDANVFKFFVDAFEKRAICVYSADQIEWPSDLGDHGGNRARLVFLSNEITSRALRSICVIDKDLDTIKDQTPGNSSLIKTDYANLNMYGLDPDDLRTFIYSRFNVSITDEQLASVFEACKHIFTTRFLKELHCVGSTIPSADDILTEPENVTFSKEKYLGRCRQLNGYDSRWNDVEQGQPSLFASLNGDFRDYINIHDLGEILVAAIRKLKSRSVTLTPDFIAKHCVYVLMAQRQFGYPLFSELSRRLT